jgi:GNAT superfamily N-acetyltransferase
LVESVRILGPGDEAALEAFLRERRDSTMFLRGNLARGGLVDRGERFQGTYGGVFRDAELVGVVAQFWNGMLMPQALTGAVTACEAVLAATGRAVSGFVGLPAQTAALRAHLGLAAASATIESDEILFGLDLDRLRVPVALAQGTVRCRRATEPDRPQLEGWSRAYHMETLDSTPGPELERRVAEGVDFGIATGTMWVLEQGTERLAMTRFNATTPECVQVGGVFTPPALRSRGYGACVVAGSLRDARTMGADRSILFTAQDNDPAQACYRSLGYETLGTYGLVLLREPHAIA